MGVIGWLLTGAAIGAALMKGTARIWAMAKVIDAEAAYEEEMARVKIRHMLEIVAVQRGEDVQIKLTPVREVVGGKRVVVVDDSIVRGTTCRRLMRSLRDAGAAEVHMRISCPPTRWPCYYGIDFPTPGELIASNQTVEQVRASLGVDSLGYLSEEAMLSTVSNPADHYCTACWSGKYRVPIEEPVTKLQHEKC